jgi:iron complex outermembrane receptor protein
VVKHAFLCGGSALAVAASLYGAPAIAATAQASASAAGVGSVGELVVVAQKREQKIESVPVAITAFSGKQRDIIGIKNTQDLSDFTPGLSYYSIADRAYIRGIGRNTTNLATASGVATYYNGVYYGANATIALQHDSLFIGNIEVDRGPQNTLHGSNADGGVINYISVRPGNELSSELRGGVDSYGYWFGEGAINVPLNDDWKVRVAGNFSQQNGGYFKNLIGPSEGGSGPQGNGGTWHYAEGQIQGTVGHLDVWAMASSGEYDTNFHTVATIGALSNYAFPSGALTPSGFFGLCGLPNTNAAQCASTPGNTVVPGSQVPIMTGGILANRFPGMNPSTADPHVFMESTTQRNTQNDDVALATNLTYHFPKFDVTYTGGYQSFYYNLFFGPGIDSGLAAYQIQGPAALGNLTMFPLGGAGTSFIEDDNYFSHELTFTSTDTGPFQWIAGGYWYHEHFDQPIGLGCYPNQPQIKAPLGKPSNPNGCVINVDGNIKYDDYAVYGHGSYKFNDQWNVAGGIRYTADHKTGFEQQRVIAFDDPFIGLPTAATLGALTPAIDITAGANAAVLVGHSTDPTAGIAAINATTGFVQRTLTGDWGAVTGDATVNWTPSPATLAYFRYARGYKAGGFNAGSLAVHPSTAAEAVDQFELGLKQTVGSTLTVNAAVFYYNYFNDQQPFTVANPTTNSTLAEILNIPEARITGFELEGTWRPIDPLTLTASYSYLSAKVTSMGGICVEDTSDPLATLPGANITGCAPIKNAAGVTTIQPQNLTGQTLPEAPANKVALNGQYAFRLEPGTLTLSASFIWKDATYGSIFNRALSLAPAYSIVNLRATWDDAKQRYTLILFANNVTDALGYDNVTKANVAQAGTPLQLVSARGLINPLVVGGEVQFRFR